MRLTTIWTIPAMTLRERLNRTGEWALRGIAYRIPQRLAYHVLIDQGARYTHRHKSAVIPKVRYMDVLKDAER